MRDFFIGYLLIDTAWNVCCFLVQTVYYTMKYSGLAVYYIAKLLFRWLGKKPQPAVTEQTA